VPDDPIIENKVRVIVPGLRASWPRFFGQ